MRKAPAILIGLICSLSFLDAALSNESRPSPIPASQPAFSWDTIPRGICIWKNKPFTDQEIAAVAKYPLVQTMVPDGIPWRKPTNTNIALQIKRHNPQAIVIGYKNIVVHYDWHANPEIFQNHPDWFIYARNGKPVQHNDKRPIHDLRKPAMRQWWLNDVHRMLGTPGFDGLLIDAITKVYYYSPLINNVSAEEHKEYIAGFHALMEETKKRFGRKGLLIGNCLRAIHDDAGLEILRKYYDGSYLESFDQPMRLPGSPVMKYEDWVAKGIESVQKASAAGKLIFLTFPAGEFNENDTADIKSKLKKGEKFDYDRIYHDHEYKIALFLICAGERSYFGYQYSRNAADDRQLWDPDFPEFHKPLGPPKGPAIRNGYTYTREFQHADVRLDLTKREGRIIWRTPEQKAVTD